MAFAKTGLLCSKFENSFPSSKPRNALSALETGLVSVPIPFVFTFQHDCLMGGQGKPLRCPGVAW